MTNDPGMIDELQAATRGMTPSELMKFRKELGRLLPGVVKYAADQARKDDRDRKQRCICISD